MWVYQLCSCLKLFWLLNIPLGSILISGWVSQFLQNRIWDFDMACIWSADLPEWYWHLNNSESFNSWTWSVFPLIYVLFNFFQNSFILFIYKSFTSLVKLIPKFFILFDAIVSGIDFLISFSYYSLLVHGDANGVYVLTLYPATSLSSFISSHNFLCVKSLGFSIYKIVSFANRY